MELIKIFKILLKYWQLIITLTMLSMLVALILSFFILDEIYISTATAIVITSPNEEEPSSLTYDDYILNTKLVNSYSVLCKTNHVLLQVIRNLDLNLTVSELMDKITIVSHGDTEFLHIVVEDTNPTIAMNIANEIAVVFKKEVNDTMHRDNVKIIDEATESSNPIRPNKSMNIITSIMGGFVLGVGLSFLLEYLDTRTKSVNEISALVKIPVLGLIPHIDVTKQVK